MLGGEFKCPYCGYYQEKDIEYFATLRCPNCKKLYGAKVKVEATTWKLEDSDAS